MATESRVDFLDVLYSNLFKADKWPSAKCIFMRRNVGNTFCLSRAEANWAVIELSLSLYN